MSFIPDVGTALHQTMFGQGGASTAQSTRIPMKFSSTLRMQQNVSVSGTLPIITMNVNPNSIEWEQPKRIVKRDTQEGSIFFHFSNTNGENNDILTLNFSGNTGNIAAQYDNEPQGSILGSNKGVSTGALSKLHIWHNLYALTREPMLLPDRTVNVFKISYTSVAIPVQIMLTGFFSTVMKWTDSATKPFSKDYSFSFTVQNISPSLNSLLGILSTANVTGTPSNAT